jgi:hypothetical protein
MGGAGSETDLRKRSRRREEKYKGLVRVDIRVSWLHDIRVSWFRNYCVAFGN